MVHFNSDFEVCCGIRRVILSVGVLRDQGIFTYFDELPRVQVHERRISSKQINRLFFWELEQVNSETPSSIRRPMLVEWAYSPSSIFTTKLTSNLQVVRLGLPMWNLTDDADVASVIDQFTDLIHAGYDISVWVSLPCHSVHSWKEDDIDTD